MNVKFLSVTTSAGTRSPRIHFHGAWLAKVGFKPGLLIQALPEPGGMVFRVCDENIQKYSDLVQETHAKGGKLIQGCCERGMSLVTSGKYISAGGLNVGDSYVARYDYGIIQLRKLPPQTKVLTTRKDEPKTRFITGKLLTDNGFVSGSLVLVSSEPGKISLVLQEQGLENYKALVKQARASKNNLMQVLDNSGQICLLIPESSLHKAGIAMTDALLAHYEYDAITLKALDFDALGF